MFEDDECKNIQERLLTSCLNNSLAHTKMVVGHASGREQIQPEPAKAIFQDGTRPAGGSWKMSDKRYNVGLKQSSALYVSWQTRNHGWMINTPAGTN